MNTPETPVQSTYSLWLALMCEGVAPYEAGAVVLEPVTTNSALCAQWPAKAEVSGAVLQALETAQHSQAAFILPLPNGHFLAALPFKGAAAGWAFFVWAHSEQHPLTERLKHLQKGIELLAGLTPVQRFASTQVENGLLPLAKQWLLQPSLKETAISLVNSLCTAVGAQRISLGRVQKDAWSLLALSFTAHFNANAQAVLTLLEAMQEAQQHKDSIYLLRQNQPTPFRQHQRLLEAQHSGYVCTFLLRQPQGILGALTLEAAEPLNSQHLALVEEALPFIERLLQLKITAEWPLFTALYQRSLGHINHWLEQSPWAKKGALPAAGIALLALLFFPARDDCTADAQLQSQLRFSITAPQEGFLKNIFVKPGQAVKKGDKLAELNEEDIRLEFSKSTSLKQQAQQEYDNALASGNRAQAAMAAEKIQQTQAQLALSEQNLKRTQLLAPTDGTISSDDISHSVGAPVKQGQILFEVSGDSDFTVQLWVDEHRISQLQAGQEGRLKLTSLPHETFYFKVLRITPLTEIKNQKNCFRVEALLNTPSAALRSGMTGVGKIHLGRKPMVWVWFHGIVDWVRLTLWI